MKCSRCSTEVSDTSTLCPTCGSSLQSSQTTPFSYLPAGAPPWPTTIPAKLPYIVDPAPAPQTVESTAPGKKRSIGKIATLITLVVLTPVLGSLVTLGVLYGNGQFNAASTPKPASIQQNAIAAQGNQISSPPSFKDAKDTTLNIALKYPSDWTAGPLNQSSEPLDYPLSSPTSNNSTVIIIHLQRYSENSSTQFPSSNDLNMADVQSIGQLPDVVNLKNVASSEPTIAGTKWSQQEITFIETKSTLKFHLTIISAQHNKGYYTMSILTPDNIYKDAMDKDIQPIIDSLQFLS